MRIISSILLLVPLYNQLPDPALYHCPTIIAEAQSVGWEEQTLSTLDNIIWAESRCQSDVVGTGAVGVLQIQYNAHEDWINKAGYSRDDLFDVETNLRVGLMLASYSLIAYGCMYQPWYMSGDWC